MTSRNGPPPTRYGSLWPGPLLEAATPDMPWLPELRARFGVWGRGEVVGEELVVLWPLVIGRRLDYLWVKRPGDDPSREVVAPGTRVTNLGEEPQVHGPDALMLEVYDDRLRGQRWRLGNTTLDRLALAPADRGIDTEDPRWSLVLARLLALEAAHGAS